MILLEPDTQELVSGAVYHPLILGDVEVQSRIRLYHSDKEEVVYLLDSYLPLQL